MYSEDIKEEIRKGISCERYLKKSKNGMYICPFCLSGTGKNKTGALKLFTILILGVVISAIEVATS